MLTIPKKRVLGKALKATCYNAYFMCQHLPYAQAGSAWWDITVGFFEVFCLLR